MGIKRDTIFAYFRRASIEDAYECLMDMLSGKLHADDPGRSVTYKGAPMEKFQRWARRDARPLLTEAELELHHELAQQTMAKSDGEATLFELIRGYVEHNLIFDGEQPLVKHDDLLGWQEMTTLLGQDMFVCARFADNDTQGGAARAVSFTWPAIIRSDNVMLTRVLERGMAENHAHLYATSQYFDLTWTAITNYYDGIGALAGRVRERLGGDGPEWRQRELADWLRRAAILRCELFAAYRDGGKQICKAEEKRRREALAYGFSHLYMGGYSHIISACRYMYGAKLRGGAVYDYALEEKIASGCKDDPLRALAGERCFLYNCFRNVFTGEFNRYQKQMFYLYLLLKAYFRAELVQSNGRAGFDNFHRYQSRKDIFPDNSVFSKEQIYLAINATLRDENMTSLELRIAPRQGAGENMDVLRRIIKTYTGFNDNAEQTRRRKNKPWMNKPWLNKTFDTDARFFFVYHLPKFKDRPDPNANVLRSKFGELYAEPRSYACRMKHKNNVLAIARMMRDEPRLWKWIAGIDGCSREIGCRPEVMAQAIRFIADFVPNPLIKNKYISPALRLPRIHKTFHVGEDFLDLADGMRAIDEAIMFLDMGRGDRLGHAIALGLDAEEYYARKASKLLLGKQDMLDNIVWLMCRAAEFGVEIRSDFGGRMREIANRLFREIYKDAKLPPFDMDTYFWAWKLRGDDPYCYFFRDAGSEEKTGGILSYLKLYDNYAKNGNIQAEYCRGIDTAGKLYMAYSFNKKARELGEEVCTITITAEFVKHVHEMQLALRRHVSQKDIAIETNPTSNKLISTFKRYDKHPIFNFYNRHLDMETNPQLYVSINTDDQGVFSTTLENEYYLLSRALECAKNPDGTEKYSHQQIRDWLDDIREMGLSQSFQRPSAGTGQDAPRG